MWKREIPSPLWGERPHPTLRGEDTVRGKPFPHRAEGKLHFVAAKRKLCFPLSVGDQGRPYAVALRLHPPHPQPSPQRGEENLLL